MVNICISTTLLCMKTGWGLAMPQGWHGQADHLPAAGLTIRASPSSPPPPSMRSGNVAPHPPSMRSANVANAQLWTSNKHANFWHLEVNWKNGTSNYKLIKEVLLVFKPQFLHFKCSLTPGLFTKTSLHCEISTSYLYKNDSVWTYKKTKAFNVGRVYICVTYWRHDIRFLLKAYSCLGLRPKRCVISIKPTPGSSEQQPRKWLWI